MPTLNDPRTVLWSNGTATYDDGLVDTETPAEPDANGLRLPRSLVLPPVTVGGERFASRWHADRYIFDLKRELAGVEHNLEHLEDPVLPWLDPPTREQLGRRRVDLEGTRDAIVATLARLEGTEPARKGKR